MFTFRRRPARPTAGLLMVSYSIFLLACGCSTMNAGSTSGEHGARVVARPTTASANTHYVSNRPPLRRNPLIKLPVGSIQPTGWLRHQLVLLRRGMVGHLDELSRWVRAENSAWLSPEGQGEFGWEEVPYWLTGFGDLGYILDDEPVRREARQWIEAVMASQDANGYFGPRVNKEPHPDLWPNMIMLYAVRSYYEATGDDRVIPFMTRYFRWQHGLSDKELLYRDEGYSRHWWQTIRAADNLDNIFWLYNRTGDDWLLELARRVHARTADWTHGVPNWHGVNIAQAFRGPAQYFMLSHDPTHHDATERNYQHIWSVYGQVPGGLFGADENCREGYDGPRQGAETCTIVEFMKSCEILLSQSGDTLHADRCEDVAYNMLPAAMTPELDGLHYITCPNQVVLDTQSKCPGIQNCGNMFAYSPFENFRCCQHNVSHGWPYFVEHLWMATQDDGIAAIFYAPSGVTFKASAGQHVTLTQTTDYPFGGNVEISVATDAPASFPLYLRIPGWCERARVRVDGRTVPLPTVPGSYVRLIETWQDGSKVQLTLDMPVRLTRWRANADAVSVHRGPLTYSLKIAERWKASQHEGRWSLKEVFPASDWNYGLLIDDPSMAEGFEVVCTSKPIPDQPFTVDNAPAALRVAARKIPNWQVDHLGLIGPLQPSPVRSDAPTETVTLIPMGCARLRVSSIPWIHPGGADWEKPKPPRHYANYVHDDINAVSDGIVPTASNDTAVPRLTWWPMRGHGQWIAYHFDAPRRVSGCEVYWFDDTPEGKCAVPAQWKILYREEGTWVEVRNASGYPTATNQFNRVMFDPIETDALKLQLRSQPDLSGGILEWRVLDAPAE